jgi:FKBP-type peptidyl-prolyl cis-trans isomerase FklB
MKTTAIILFLLTTALSVSLPAQKKVTGTANRTAAAPAPVQVPLHLKNYKDSVQYALGVYIGQFLINGDFTTVDLDLFVAGIQDIFQKRPRLINDSLISPLVSAYQEKARQERGKELEAQLFSALKDQPNVGKLPSGVQYSVLKTGKGPRPLETDSITIHFKGTLPDGRVFENTFLSNNPVRTTPGSLIPGLNEVLQLMQTGSTWLVIIPAAMAYGEKGNGAIPPNSAVLITVELLSVRDKI